VMTFGVGLADEQNAERQCHHTNLHTHSDPGPEPNSQPRLHPNQIHRRTELEERCRYLLAADEIIEAEGLDVEAKGVEEEVERAREQFAVQGLGEFSEEGYR